MAAPAEPEEALRRLEELLTELFRFRDGLPAPKESGSEAGSDALEEEMEKTLKLMEEVEVSPQGSSEGFGASGSSSGVCEAGASRAEEALSRAYGSLWSLWVPVGSMGRRGSRWLTVQGEDAEAHRLLSMALRAGATGAEPGPLRESLAQAEAAVRCDPTDGRSWYVLGNAYVALFFAVGQSPDLARRALAAYAQAERVDPEASKNPDLHLNRATLLQYEERWAQALDGFATASALAPQWPEPRKRRAQLLDFLGRLCQGLRAVSPQSRSRRRRPPLSPPRCPPGAALSPLAALQPGPNARRLLGGRVLFCLRPDGGVPVALGLMDASGSVAAVTVYNAAPNWGASMGDSIAVTDPVLSHQHVLHQGQTFSFAAVRAPSPLSLLLNGRRPPPPALAPPTLALSAPPEP
ncbi:tetratricopeptide repeat protein 5 [Cuculus canorus]|uniref:tetratricopeptide repeat protein 5 n=1 Tax=Cuculus canorus TaxID=55661 RepID=UPI0023AA7C98|nr:tetratricopeptide repeat protein 5 [Cuculus canorus]